MVCTLVEEGVKIIRKIFLSCWSFQNFQHRFILEEVTRMELCKDLESTERHLIPSKISPHHLDLLRSTYITCSSFPNQVIHKLIEEHYDFPEGVRKNDMRSDQRYSRYPVSNQCRSFSSLIRAENASSIYYPIP